MTINFHDKKNQLSYSSRIASDTWTRFIEETTDLVGKKVVDIGCGGGIYAKQMIELGAASVTGIDFSEPMLESARANCQGYENITFQQGNALQTDLPDNHYDAILERAVIHHILDLAACFQEAHRLLKEEGTFIIQDRTSEDCFLEGSPTHIRGYFFSKFPRLKEIENKRRYSSRVVINHLKEIGFTKVEEYRLWETRKTYQNFDELAKDILNRTGRSLLHSLTDIELQNLIEYIHSKIPNAGPIEEKDRWTIWKAIK